MLRFQGLGVRFKNSGVKVEGLGFGVEDKGFMFQGFGLGFCVWGSGLRVLSAGSDRPAFNETEKEDLVDRAHDDPFSGIRCGANLEQIRYSRLDFDLDLTCFSARKSQL